MSDDTPFAQGGDTGETEAVHAPHRDDDPPTGSRKHQTAWLVGLGIMLLLILGMLAAWGVGMLDSA